MILHWIIFSAIILFIPLAFTFFRVKVIGKQTLTEQQKKNADLTTGKYILLFWFYDLLYMAIFNQWQVLIYIFGILAVIIVFTNLTRALLSENKALYALLPYDLIFGVGLCVYLIYIIPDAALQNIVTAVVAALFGGVLTLIGVAWTIKHTQKERKDDEIKKAKPIFTYNMLLQPIENAVGRKVCFEENLEEFDCSVFAEIENSEHSVFTIEKIYHDGKWQSVAGNNVILPNKTVYLDFKFSYVNDLFMEVKDGLGNLYYYEIKVLSINLLTKVPPTNTPLKHTIKVFFIYTKEKVFPSRRKLFQLNVIVIFVDVPI